MGFEESVGLIIWGVIFGVILVAITLAIYGFSGLPKGCNKNCLCENKYTIWKGYDDRAEGTLVPCFLEDCCYSEARAKEVCEENFKNYMLKSKGILPSDEEVIKACNDTSKKNPLTYFDCAESVELCNNESCVQSCDLDMNCEEGESRRCCVDCV